MSRRPLTSAQVDAFNRAMATVAIETPTPAARGPNICALCFGALIRPPFMFLAVESPGRKGPPEQSRLDAEQIGLHGRCGEDWYEQRRQRAHVLMRQAEAA